jgi:hypothetical protein
MGVLLKYLSVVQKGVVMGDAKQLVPVELIQNKIFLIRGQKVLLAADLAELYGVQPKVLNQAVKRNAERFPADFVFQLTRDEAENIMRSRPQNVTLKRGHNIKYLPYAFTEHGAAMAATVLNSPQAIEISIFIVRAFIQLRQMIYTSKELKRELNELKQQTNDRFQIVFEALDQLLAVQDQPKRKIGFTAKEKRAAYSMIQSKKIAAR